MMVKFESLYKRNMDNILRPSAKKVQSTMAQAPSTAKMKDIFLNIFCTMTYMTHV